MKFNSKGWPCERDWMWGKRLFIGEKWLSSRRKVSGKGCWLPGKTNWNDVRCGGPRETKRGFQSQWSSIEYHWASPCHAPTPKKKKSQFLLNCVFRWLCYDDQANPISHLSFTSNSTKAKLLPVICITGAAFQAPVIRHLLTQQHSPRQNIISGMTRGNYHARMNDARCGSKKSAVWLSGTLPSVANLSNYSPRVLPHSKWADMPVTRNCTSCSWLLGLLHLGYCKCLL